MEIDVKIGSQVLHNPVGVASGTFGYGSEYERLIDLNSLGALYTKAVTPEPREGNDIPRIVETTAGMLNSIGLANVGVDKFISDKIPYLAGFDCAVVVNVAGAVEEDYISVIEKLETNIDVIWGYEINISCPNVKKGGIAFGTDCIQVESLTAALKKRTDRPVIVKLTPNVTDIGEIAKSAEAGGADAISCINTLRGMIVDIHKKRPVLPMKTGGLSGPAILPVGVALTYQAARAVSIPVIGLGGIMSGEDAVQYLLAGASAVQIGTGTFVDPGIPIKTLEFIKEYMKNNGLKRISDFHAFIK